MLTFLYVAMHAGFVVERYEDEAVGVMRKNERGAIWVAAVTLHPRIVYGGAEAPDSGRGGPPPPPGPRAMLHRQLGEDRDPGGPTRGMSDLSVLFDLDGTLTDPHAGITASIRHALAQIERECPADDELAAQVEEDGEVAHAAGGPP